MSNKQFVTFILKTIGTSLLWWVSIIGPCLLYYLCVWVANVSHMNRWYVLVITFSIVQLYIFFLHLKYNINKNWDDLENLIASERKNLKYEKVKAEKEIKEMKMLAEQELIKRKIQFERYLRKEKSSAEIELASHKIRLNQDYREKIDKSNAEIKRIESESYNKVIDAENKVKSMYNLLKSSAPFSSCADMMADIFLTHYTNSEKNLRYKSHPAIKAANEVKELRTETRDYLFRLKTIEYKLDYIKTRFPDLSNLIDSDEELISVGEVASSYSILEDIRDHRLDYLTADEYERLTDCEKSQLALDRYVNSRNKNTWYIGRDYEMSCAFQLQEQGYEVEMHGIKYKKGDLGRDVIAKKHHNDLFGDEILIIQCKNWGREKEIHENTIMQLFGTTVAYKIDNPQFNQEIIPVLMIPPYTNISPVAEQFADILKIRIYRMDNVDFPRIKCNVNNGMKIYHLPFDQQYDKTEIKFFGEFYAYTVAEAESKGFRRAMRYNFNANT